MNNEMVTDLHKSFEDIAKNENGVTYWLARDIQPLLDYTRWENFETAIERAKNACKTAGQPIDNHFREVTKMVDIGSETSRKINDLMLTRYACYLIAQNGDPRKEAIAFAQSYFAIQTRKQEILQERLQLAERIQARTKLTETERQLSGILYEHGVDDRGFGAVRSMDDNALFGGNNTAEMKRRLGVKDSRALADFLPTVTLKAKEFASAITAFNVRKLNLFGVKEISGEHVKNNKDVRAVLAKSNIQPENLPAEEDIQKLERRIRSHDTKLLKSEGGLDQLDKKTSR
ncbi:MAG: DNA damage-inducible protein D [Alphaproteobacteria bacterium]|nr:DNA damage-inducible protein D [Alphaproteobacteria bacterium]